MGARSKSRGLAGGLVRRAIVFLLLIGIAIPVAVTVLYRFVPPPITFLMLQRLAEGRGLERQWKPIDEISPRLVRAVIAAEDARFCQHHGFDIDAIEQALEHNQRSQKVRGGSTISQQTAKNVFLWPQRSYLRKGLEAYFTVLIEGIWGKRRIMEVYLNSIEWGPGVYGVEAAARKNFGRSAANLNATQAARLAAILPSPLKWRAADPGPYVRKRSLRITRAASAVRRDGLADCVLR